MSDAAVRFTFVLYTQPCEAQRGITERNMSRAYRLSMYGDGLMKNAIAIAEFFPRAQMLVYILNAELEGDAAVGEFAAKLQAHANVRLVPFTIEDVGGASCPLSVGQQLRCARYLPMFGRARDADAAMDIEAGAGAGAGAGKEIKAGEKETGANTFVRTLAHAGTMLPRHDGDKGDKGARIVLEDLQAHLRTNLHTDVGRTCSCGRNHTEGDFVPVVARDADSIVTRRDAALIERWIASGTRWLVYQEHAMSQGMPMGGGLACAAPTCMTLGAAMGMLGPKDVDEEVLSMVMPVALHMHDHVTAETREGAVSFGGSCPTDSFMYVHTRMSCRNDWYTWDAATGVGVLLWPLHCNVTSARVTDPARVSDQTRAGMKRLLRVDAVIDGEADGEWTR